MDGWIDGWMDGWMDDDGWMMMDSLIGSRWGVGALLEISKSIVLRDDGRFLNAEQSCHRIGETAKPSYATHRFGKNMMIQGWKCSYIIREGRASSTCQSDANNRGCIIVHSGNHAASTRGYDCSKCLRPRTCQNLQNKIEHHWLH